MKVCCLGRPSKNAGRIISKSGGRVVLFDVWVEAALDSVPQESGCWDCCIGLASVSTPGSTIIKSRPVQSIIELEFDVTLDLSSMLHRTWVQCNIELKSKDFSYLSSMFCWTQVQCCIELKSKVTLYLSPMWHWNWIAFFNPKICFP